MLTKRLEKMIKYSVIKGKTQYREYSAKLKELWENPNHKNEDARELLELLIEKWEENNLKHKDIHPIELIKYLMNNHNLKSSDMVKILNVNKGTISKILACQSGLSKDVIRDLSSYFKVSQEAFNKPYVLKSIANKGHKNEKMMNTEKVLVLS